VTPKGPSELHQAGDAKPSPLQHPATLRDVAEVAGVHVTTASRALNPKAQQLVNAETVRRVMRAAEALGYQPNPIARSLKTSKSSTVGPAHPRRVGRAVDALASRKFAHT
jgi:LacI family transcriptional regulator